MPSDESAAASTKSMAGKKGSGASTAYAAVAVVCSVLYMLYERRSRFVLSGAAKPPSSTADGDNAPGE